MMKIIFGLFACIAFSVAHAQSRVVEEKASEWITVTAVTKPAVKKKTKQKQAPVKPKSGSEEFEETNQKVNRFGKQKNG